MTPISTSASAMDQKLLAENSTDAKLEAEAEVVGKRLFDRGVWVSADLRVYPETAADLLPTELSVLKKWRSEDHPLPFVKCSRVTYGIIDLLRYIRSNSHRRINLAKRKR